MRSFEYFTPTKVIFGKDTHLQIGTLLKDQTVKSTDPLRWTQCCKIWSDR